MQTCTVFWVLFAILVISETFGEDDNMVLDNLPCKKVGKYDRVIIKKLDGSTESCVCEEVKVPTTTTTMATTPRGRRPAHVERPHGVRWACTATPPTTVTQRNKMRRVIFSRAMSNQIGTSNF
ncbi:uncharacterized protein LOC110854663 [Folsomia candida]|uniref:Uncharacterized protein n=1 Tax=Folsomia candida TaxID=158441 RepID=A0A226DXQ9_FOLCA|nr:uncharacterized protein LOC110854663 [Folsomia candida]OXA49818.1 hypothetical protein Fcan01_15520 [Folsomia candida]